MEPAEGLKIGDVITFTAVPRLPFWKRFLNFFGAGYKPPEPVLKEFVITNCAWSDEISSKTFLTGFDKLL